MKKRDGLKLNLSGESVGKVFVLLVPVILTGLVVWSQYLVRQRTDNRAGAVNNCCNTSGFKNCSSPQDWTDGYYACLAGACSVCAGTSGVTCDGDGCCEPGEDESHCQNDCVRNSSGVVVDKNSSVCGSGGGTSSSTGSSGSVEYCDSSSKTARYCQGKVVGKDWGVCVCTRTTGTACSCVAGGVTTPTPTPNPYHDCEVEVGGVMYTVAFGVCACEVPGYEDKRCVGDKGWYPSRDYCDAKCNPGIPIPQEGDSCNKLGDSADNLPEPDCEGKKVGDVCGDSRIKQTCQVVDGGSSFQYCDCLLQ